MGRLCMWGLLLLVAVHCVQARWIIRDGSGAPALEIFFQENARQVYIDEWTSAWDYLGIWEADEVEGFSMMGHKAQGNWDEMEENIIMAKDLGNWIGGRYLKNPLDFEQVWRDQGGWGTYDVGFWRPECPTGYRAMGDIAFACEWCGWPKPLTYLGRIKCVDQDLTVLCNTKSSPVWTNDGGFEDEDGSVWEIDAGNTGMSTFWLGNKGHSTPPQNSVAYCLKRPEFVEG